jgi:hypothetical protein
MDPIQRWVARQFTTRVIVMMPVAIAINIVLGASVQQGLKLPIYLDSIGTILVGVLAGPLAGALTGILSNLIWGYVIPAPIGSTVIGPFAITAGVIGLLAGLWGQLGLFRPRKGHVVSIAGAVVAVVLVAALALYTYSRAYASPDAFNNNVFGNASITMDQSRAFFLVVMVVYVALVASALFLRRDVGAVYAIGAGLVTGIAAAVVSAPISAVVYGGPSRWRQPLPVDTQAGPSVRPDGQDDHLVRRVLHHRQPVAKVRSSLPQRREGDRGRARLAARA